MEGERRQTLPDSRTVGDDVGIPTVLVLDSNEGARHDAVRWILNLVFLASTLESQYLMLHRRDTRSEVADDDVLALPGSSRCPRIPRSSIFKSDSKCQFSY